MSPAVATSIEHPLEWRKQNAAALSRMRPLVQSLLQKNIVKKHVFKGSVLLLYVPKVLSPEWASAVGGELGIRVVQVESLSEFGLWKQILQARAPIRRKLARDYPSLRELKLPEDPREVRGIQRLVKPVEGKLKVEPEPKPKKVVPWVPEAPEGGEA